MDDPESGVPRPRKAGFEMLRHPMFKNCLERAMVRFERAMVSSESSYSQELLQGL
jgi:hypothetical protein